jgi:hypothetical protein
MKSEQFMNLTVHRSEADTWERRRWRDRYLDERMALCLVSMAGATLLLYGAFSASRRTASSRWWVMSGASLLGGAAAVFGSRHSRRMVRPDQDPAVEDVVTRESLDSFPASDAPSSNATTANPQPLRRAD